MLNACKNETAFLRHILQMLDQSAQGKVIFPGDVESSFKASAVLFLLGRHPEKKEFEPCIILTKRSQNVKQSGDLCCPGGSISPGKDVFLSRLIRWPVFPIGKWPYWATWRRRRASEFRRLSLLLATALRESYEEMRLNPLGVKFLGPLPSQKLTIFRREIYPMAAWVKHQRKFVTNWEVEKIVHIPLWEMLKPENYCRYHLQMRSFGSETVRDMDDFPCFRRIDQKDADILWGATYRIAMAFLKLVFGFDPPQPVNLPVYRGMLDENYYTNDPG